MGEAKQRGSQAERADQARARLEGMRPAQLVCGACKTAFSTFDAIDAPNLRGIDAVFGGQCPSCGNDVLVFKGEPQAVADAMVAWERMMGADTKLGYQSRDGKHVPFEEGK
ncbi:MULTISPECIES: hypothetical protein [Cupriavidus]|uniref:Uncharacterized protein n=1 Tax=Cupriavidus basilensis TaxID=68895 RepID=A0A0C4YPQ2_9BURK|nr:MULTISPECIES: hypothetical protein [Cupriavidus]AJG25028.1 hypothetical protein RR42_s3452 [Cupriavidus basilensis]MBB1633463.1 hypothetical protein [Cupriavidus sp. UME77]MCP3019219.1 hypothetical protein [Cupriavidus basilensis]QOT79934.1 hypothetical protein F7R26_035375 [Cupriavidus basilensis]